RRSGAHYRERLRVDHADAVRIAVAHVEPLTVLARRDAARSLADSNRPDHGPRRRVDHRHVVGLFVGDEHAELGAGPLGAEQERRGEHDGAGEMGSRHADEPPPDRTRESRGCRRVYGERCTDSRKPRTFWIPSSPKRSFQAGIPLSTRPTVIVAYAVS